MGDEPPSDGHLSVCLVCGEASIYDSTSLHGLRRPSREEKIEIYGDPNMRAYDAIN
jgi:hypothetical protein